MTSTFSTPGDFEKKPTSGRERDVDRDDLEDLLGVLSAGTERPPEQYMCDGVSPIMAARPSSVSELAEILLVANQRNLAVMPQGGRTALTLGRPLTHYDLALDTTALNRVLDYAPEDLTITVEAGITLKLLQESLAEQGQYLPIDPPPGDQVTIGGLLATARSGAWRGHLPAARDLILGATVASPDGSLTRSGGRVVKNVSGYDMHRMHTGALGTLGVIVEASFKLSPLPAAVSSFAIVCSSLSRAGTVACEIWDRNLATRAITILDSKTSAILDCGDVATVLVEFAASESVVVRSEETLREILRDYDMSAEHIGNDIWAQIRSLTHRDGIDTVIRAGVPASEVSGFIDHMEIIDGPSWGHVAAGSVWSCPNVNAQTLLGLRVVAEKLGGFLQLESGSKSLREVVDPFGVSDAGLTDSLKSQFDPRSTLNPGKWKAVST